ncbi:MAG: phosphate ABC transporter substrate-binding protein [Candidatus Elarobacter sp.]
MKRNAALAALLLGFSVVAASAPAFADTTITIAGSTALLPLVKDAAAAYQQAHPDVKISVSGGGSGTGINQVAAKAIDIGDSDILAPSHPELHDNRVAVVGFAVIAHPGVGAKSLSKKQLQDIFSGKVTNWKDVGGADQKIVVVNRPRNSGTRAVFGKTVMGTVAISESGLTEDATGTVVSVVKQTPGAISYAALSGTRGGGLNELAVDGVTPTDENIINGKYPIWSYEHMFTMGAPTGEISRFIAFVQSHADLVRKDGFILIRDMKVKETDR